MVQLRLVLLVIAIAMVIAVLTQWWWLVGFDPSDKRWWSWLIAVLKDSGTSLPAGMEAAMLYAGIPGVLCMAVASAGLARTAARTKFGDFSAKEIHGSAAWASAADIQKAGLFSKRGIQVAGWSRGVGGLRPLRHDGPEHILCFAPTRSGKGVSLVVPALLEWPDSVFVFDIKGENHALSAGYRASAGQRVIRFDPTARAGVDRFNPLAEIRIGDGGEIRDAQSIALALIDPDGRGLKDHWMREGAAWLSAAILHVLFRSRVCVGQVANLNDVREFLSQVDDEVDANAEDPMDAMLDAMVAFEHGELSVDREVHGAATTMRMKDYKERSGVHSTALAALRLFSDPIVAANTGASDFALGDLCGDQPVSFYLVIPPSDIDRLRPLTQMMIAMLVRHLTENFEARAGKRKLLLLLDEFTALGKVEILERALAYLAGYGVKAFLIVQDLAMLRGVYGPHEAVSGNCHVQIAFAPNVLGTAKVISEMVGRTTVVQKRRSASGSLGGRNSINKSETETGRPLLTADEAMRMGRLNTGGGGAKPGEVLVLAAGCRPIRARQKLFFQDRELRRRAAMSPPAAKPRDRVGG